jgi:hypothetical protein
MARSLHRSGVRSGEPYLAIPMVNHHRFLATTFAAAAAFAALTCGGSTSVSSVSGPDAVKCQTALSAENSGVPAEGGRVIVNVTAARECAWNASSDVPWVGVSPTTGQGSGSLTATVAANDRSATRTGAVIVNDQRLNIAQEARPCRFTLGQPSIQMSRDGGPGSVQVTTSDDCTWHASTSTAWIHVLTGSGTGTGAVDFQVDNNNDGAREGSIVIADQHFTINQNPASGPAPPPPTATCTPVVRPTTIDASAAGGSETIQIEVGSGCDWVATSSASWITITPPASGRGNASLQLAIAPNTSAAARTATVTVAQQPVTVRQAGAPATCTFTLDPTSQTFGPSGGEGRVRVNTQQGCEWTATTGSGWVRISSTRGTGNGEVRYTVEANASSTASRSATITIGGQTHTVTQQGAAPQCTFSIDPPQLSFKAAGGEGRVKVNTQSGCQWSASSHATWAVVSSNSGTGSGEVVYSVQANTATTARSTTISIGDRTHTVDQEAAAPPPPTCTFTLSPASQNFSATGGQGHMTVTTQPGCQWRASSAAAWVSLSTVSGTGSADVTYSVQANTAMAARSTTITIGGQTHTVTQDAAAPPCTFTINPSSQNFTASGGEGRFTVTTQAGCQWSATSSAAWLTITSGSGTGTGDVVYVVQPNTATTPRSTAVTLNGQTYTVNQEAAAPPTCTFVLSPTSLKFGAEGGEGRFTVTTQAGCQWKASSDASWAVVTSGSGTGSGEVVYAVQPNTDGARSMSITVGSQAHSVMQTASAQM